MRETIEKICQLSLAKKLGILFGTLAFIGLIFWLYLMSPVFTEVTKAEEELETVRMEVVRREGIAKNLGKFKEEVVRLDGELNKALKELPDKKAIAGLLSKISDKAQDSGLEVSLFRPQGESKKDFYAEVPVEMKVRGTYHQVATFFDEVGRMSRIVNLGKIEMEQPEILEGDNTAILETSIIATTFRFLEESEREEIRKKKEKGKRKKKRKRKKA